MRDFFRVAAAVPAVSPANTKKNIESIRSIIEQACKNDVAVVVFPELCITGYTCADLFHNRALLDDARTALSDLLKATAELNIVFAVGLPLEKDNRLYNVAAICHKGRVCAFIPKTYIPNYNEFYEKRWFALKTGLDEYGRVWRL